MKSWVLWILVSILFISILFGTGTIMYKYINTVNYVKSPSTGNDHIKWDNTLLKEKSKENKLAIFVDINAKTLQLVDLETNEAVKKYYIASGKPKTPTPLGSYIITSKAKWGEVFGTRWMGLNVRWGNCN